MSILDKFKKPKPPLILTQYGPVTESARAQAAANMKADPALRKAVEELICNQVGNVANGLAECKRRYPEAYTDE